MTQRARTTLPVIVATAVGLSSAAIMFVPRGDAASAPTPSTFSAETEGEVWRVNKLDLDMSGDPVTTDVAVGNVAGDLGSAAAPDRSWSIAHNLVGEPTPTGHASAASTATADQDTVGTATGSGQAGSVPDTLNYGAATLTARSRWGGDETCLDPAVPLTSSRVVNQGSTAIPPAAIPPGTPPPFLPIPLPTSVPTEIPTELPSDFPTLLPTDLPTLDPTLLPTDLPTTDLPTLPTDLPTDLPTSDLPTLPTDLPTTLLPTITLPPLPRTGARAEGDVSMASVAPASIEEKTFLQPSIEQYRRVAGEVVGRVTTPSQPAMTFFGGEASLIMTGEARLSAYSNGSGNGSQVDWTAPQMALRVGDVDYEVPQDGTALALPYSQNEDVVLTVAAGKLTAAESPTGELAQATVTVLNVLIKNGDDVVLDAELFPMSLKLTAPQGGIDCTPVAPTPEPVDAGLKLKGKGNGKKADKLQANATKLADGAKVSLFKVVHGKQKKLKTATLNKKGDRAFKVKDKNGKKPTTYLVKVGKTELTLKDVARKKIR